MLSYHTGRNATEAEVGRHLEYKKSMTLRERNIKIISERFNGTGYVSDA